MPVVLQSVSGSELPVTVSDLIAATHDHLQGTYNSEYNTLLNPIAATDTTLALSGPLGGAVRTAWLAIDDEILYVMAGNQATGVCTVIRGWDGTLPQAHLANAVVEVRPRFPRHVIRRQLALEIASWPDNLFQTASVQFALVQDGRTFLYDMGVPSSQVRYVLDVRHAPWSGTDRNTWPKFSTPCEVVRNMDPTVFPSGLALKIPATDVGGLIGIRGAVSCRVTYATPFNIANMDDTVLLGPGGIGLANSMLDIPPLGAASRLIGPREAVRSFTEAQDQTRTNQDVPAGSALRVAAYLDNKRDVRIAEEIEHLNTTWPTRLK